MENNLIDSQQTESFQRERYNVLQERHNLISELFQDRVTLLRENIEEIIEVIEDKTVVVLPKAHQSFLVHASKDIEKQLGILALITEEIKNEMDNILRSISKNNSKQ